MPHNLGKHGQSFFSGLCDEEGLTVNQSLEEDKYGWDHFVEFPREKTSILPIDQMPSPIECKIQVKSTRKKEGKMTTKKERKEERKIERIKRRKKERQKGRKKERKEERKEERKQEKKR